MEYQILGIYIAKNKFDCAFIAYPSNNCDNGKNARSKVLPNNDIGFTQLIAWLAKNKGTEHKNIKVYYSCYFYFVLTISFKKNQIFKIRSPRPIPAAPVRTVSKMEFCGKLASRLSNLSLGPVTSTV